MPLTACALLKTPHCGVFRAFGAPDPLRLEYINMNLGGFPIAPQTPFGLKCINLN